MDLAELLSMVASRRRRLTMQVYGGLGGQLAGLAYAIWMHDNYQVETRLVFNSGGVSHRPLSISKLLHLKEITSRGITYFQIHGVVGSRGRTVRQMIEPWVVGLRPLTHDFEIITREDFAQMQGNRMRVKGYPVDFRVMDSIFEELRFAVGGSGYPNFLEQQPPRNTIAIHWRLGDFVGNHFHGVVTSDSIAEGLDICCPQWRNKTLEIYTDSPDLLANGRFQSVLGDYKVISGDIWSDLRGMCSASSFLGNHSSISQWAALSMVRNATDPTVVLPTRWSFGTAKSEIALPSPAMKERMIWEPKLSPTLT
jgi:hypothetical protein